MCDMRHITARAASLALVALLALAGCSSSEDGSAATGSTGTDLSGLSTVEVAPEEAGGAAADSADAGTSAAGSEVDPDQGKVVVTGSASVRVEDPQAALAALTATVAGLGGRVASSTVTGGGSVPSARAQVRVPTDAYERLTDSLSDLGQVVDLSTSTEDVGQQVADLDARADALSASIDRLTQLVEQAETTKDLLEAEQELTARQSELDSLTSQRAYLADQIAYSTLEVSLDRRAEAAEPDRSVWQRSWDAFVAGMRGIGEAVVWVLPWALLAAVVAAAVTLAVRRRRGRAGSPALRAGGEGGTSEEPERPVDHIG